MNGDEFDSVFFARIQCIVSGIRHSCRRQAREGSGRGRPCGWCRRRAGEPCRRETRNRCLARGVPRRFRSALVHLRRGPMPRPPPSHLERGTEHSVTRARTARRPWMLRSARRVVSSATLCGCSDIEKPPRVRSSHQGIHISSPHSMD